ncbi:MAG: cytochrome c [Gemmatimonadetes bacterium]|nr:cytochrome c [Gemmatimonadota bacterium]MBK7714347.1 cytochrome c [Gemmatimonadota bacterium]MBK9068539.1 cytochrome c [Gemmatimonadota bacterium]MBP6668689.1 cytochrome c [Gemmatimonadales bacterium]MBP9199547.1 cytochrome c [Gemmatimonadales bacterium]
MSSIRLHSLALLSALGAAGAGAGAVGDPRPDQPVAARAPVATDSADYQICSACHQPNGQGIPKTFPPLAGSTIVNGPGGPHIAIVLKGLVGPTTVKGQVYNGAMAPWESLTDAQIAGAINYERTHWGNTGAKVTVADVARVRQLVKARKTPFTMDDLKKLKL